jgi:glycosyltransferase involved in cell wall biosynthesis
LPGPPNGTTVNPPLHQTTDHQLPNAATSTRSNQRTELVVFSHLRWDFVWQRPQHLIARIAQQFDHTIFVEEPRPVDRDGSPRWVVEPGELLDRAWLEVPSTKRHLGFDEPELAAHLDGLVAGLCSEATRTAWLYTPLALDVANAVGPSTIVYDVMDDLASFAHAASGMRTMQDRLLQCADIVFTGGRSLQRGVHARRPDAHCFPSGVEREHYEPAVAMRAAITRPRPVAGYVGVIDERLDLGLIGGLAAALPDWDVHIVGPVVKIDPADLPIAPNLHYLGQRSYHELPDVMAGFDVALMPFALNEATRSISPTKSLEYLAAGLGVISTRVPDVVSDLGAVVELEDDAAGFAAACRRLLAGDPVTRHRAARSLLKWNHWDAIAERMSAQLLRRARTIERSEAAESQLVQDAAVGS